MAYNYISLVNEIQRRLNEVELTSSTFLTAAGPYSLCKDAVNSSVRHINQEEFQWPWNHVEQHETVSAGTVRYSFPYDSKTVDMGSFRIKKDATLSISTSRLKSINYKEYLDKYIDSEYNYDNDVRGIPKYIARTPSNEFVMAPSPDKDYKIVYEYYTSSFDLQNETDIPTIPEQYRHVIADGAMYYTYMFRSDAQAANLSIEKFKDGIKQMRSLHINRTDYLIDTRVHF